MLLRLSGFLPEPIAKIQKSLERDAHWKEKLKNIAINLEKPIKISTFADLTRGLSPYEKR